jgi:hypothetical protein
MDQLNNQPNPMVYTPVPGAPNATQIPAQASSEPAPTNQPAQQPAAQQPPKPHFIETAEREAAELEQMISDVNKQFSGTQDGASTPSPDSQQSQGTPFPGQSQQPIQPDPKVSMQQGPSVDEVMRNYRTLEHSHRVLQGKYDSEIPRFQEQLRQYHAAVQERDAEIARLDAEIESLKAQSGSSGQASLGGGAPGTLDPEQFKEYEPMFQDMAKVVNESRAALNAQKSEIERLNGVIAQFGQERQQQQAAYAKMGFDQEMSQLCPEWKDINHNRLWIQWLNQPDDLTGKVRKTLVSDDWQNRDAQSVARVFNTFKRMNPDYAAYGSTKDGQPNAPQNQQGAQFMAPNQQQSQQAQSPQHNLQRFQGPDNQIYVQVNGQYVLESQYLAATNQQNQQQQFRPIGNDPNQPGNQPAGQVNFQFGNLESQMEPNRQVTTTAQNDLLSQQYFSVEQVDEFTSAVAKGRYRNNPELARRIEAMIDKASMEGRIVGKPSTGKFGPSDFSAMNQGGGGMILPR